MNKFSIIIPIFNCEKYIEKCINSILIQTFKDFELILVDDGSTDNSGKICDFFADKDNRIKVIHKKNAGVSEARNEGINIASGEYITFVDADDWLEQNAYKTIYEKIKENNVDMLIFNYNIAKNCKINKNRYFVENCIMTEKKDIQIIQANILAPAITKNNTKKALIGGYPWNKIYKKKIIKENNIYFEMNCKNAVFEDVIFNYKYLENVNSVEIIDEALYNYRILNNSATRKYNNNILEINKFIFAEIEKCAYSHKDDNNYVDSFNLRKINNLFYALKVYFCNKKNNKTFVKRFREFKKVITEDNTYVNAFTKLNEVYCNKKTKIIKILFKNNMYFIAFCMFDFFINIKEKREKR